MLNPAYIPKLLKIIRATLFPNNAPGPPKRIPDPTEVIAIRRRCAETIVAAVPKMALARYFGVVDGESEDVVVEVEEMLGVLGRGPCLRGLFPGVLGGGGGPGANFRF